MRLRISLRELEVFVAVAEAGTVTAAADYIGLTQSAASQALANLEGGMSVPLFDRVGRRLVLNEQGRLLWPRAQALLDEAGAMQDLFTREGALHLRLAASTTIGNYLLPERLARFRLRYPQARVELLVANTADVVEAVTAFRVDAGFIEGPAHHPALQVVPWREDRMCVFAAAEHPLAGHPLSLETLAAAEWVLRESGSGTREEVERLLLPHLTCLGKVMELGNSEAIKRTVAAGLGISCLSRHVVEEWLKSGRLVELETPLPPLSRTLYLVRHQARRAGRGLEAFLSLEPEEE